MNNRRRKTGDKGAPRWMVTFSDLMTLILVFFILLFSMSQIDIVKFQAVADSFRDRVVFDFYPSLVPMENPAEGENDPKDNMPEDQSPKKDPEEPDDSQDQSEDQMEELMYEVQSFLTQSGLDDVASANRTERGIVLILQEQVLFDSGRADIKKGAESFLQKVGNLITQIPNDIKVEGHADNRPMSSNLYPSNWELSSARASNVVRYFTENLAIEDHRFSIAAYSDTRPIAKNDTPENMAKNRRVEIIILDPDYMN
ncbi:flagellar motor protein MotS [Bacillaceae bacterium S4-13-58]